MQGSDLVPKPATDLNMSYGPERQTGILITSKSQQKYLP